MGKRLGWDKKRLGVIQLRVMNGDHYSKKDGPYWKGEMRHK